MDIVIDRIALWRAKINDEFTVRTSAVGTRYKTKDGVALVADKPIYRYAKTYAVKDGDSELKYTLFVRTFNANAKKAEQKLDEAAKTITAEQVREIITSAAYSDFTYLNEYMEA